MFFLSMLLAMILTVAMYVTLESFNLSVGKPPLSTGNNFQQIVYGVGLGATTKPRWCYINFDPRVDPRCPCIEWPIPGGYCYCPDHTGTISYMSGKVKMGATIEILNNKFQKNN